MAVSTVKPAGGGDYTTVQAWYDDRKTVGGASESAECYGGGTLGALSFNTDWTPSSAFIYAASGHQHQGLAGTGTSYAYTTAQWIFAYSSVNVTGISFVNEGIVAEYNGSNGGLEVVKCMIDISTTAPASGSMIFCYIVDGDASTVGNLTVHDCVMYWRPASATLTAAVWFVASVTGGGSTDCAFVCYNNTVLASTAGLAAGFVYGDDGNCAATFSGQNNLAIGSSLDFDLGGAPSILAEGYNGSSDFNALNWGATGAVSGLVAASTVTNAATNATLKTGSSAINAGTTTSGTDIIGTSRPQGAAYDIGCFEYIEAAAGNPMIFPNRVW